VLASIYLLTAVGITPSSTNPLSKKVVLVQILSPDVMSFSHLPNEEANSSVCDAALNDTRAGGYQIQRKANPALPLNFGLVFKKASLS
jgi:hypothetical protein